MIKFKTDFKSNKIHRNLIFQADFENYIELLSHDFDAEKRTKKNIKSIHKKHFSLNKFGVYIDLRSFLHEVNAFS